MIYCFNYFFAIYRFGLSNRLSLKYLGGEQLSLAEASNIYHGEKFKFRYFDIPSSLFNKEQTSMDKLFIIGNYAFRR